MTHEAVLADDIYLIYMYNVHPIYIYCMQHKVMVVGLYFII